MRVGKGLCKILLCVFACVLVLFVGLTVPSAAREEAVLCDWVYHSNPLYPRLQTVGECRLLPARAAGEPICRDTLAEAAQDLVQGIQKREETITVSFLSGVYEKELASKLFEMAMSHTGDPTGGDYILWHYNGWSAGLRGWYQGSGYGVEITYAMQYLSTAAQEKELDSAVQTLLDQLDVYDATDYEKVVAIYDYLCENVEYDYTGAQNGNARAHTAYAALIDGKAVCQGYASLFYRLALALDVDSRVISGIGNGGPHGWNIVRLNGKYYDLDATWDAVYKQNDQPYQYFLRCDANFEDHQRDAKYLSEAFVQLYPMAQEDYDPTKAVMVGDLDDTGRVTEDDAIYLLQYVLMPELFEVTQTVDFDKNGKIDEDDAIYLLQHVLMPEFFPL